MRQLRNKQRAVFLSHLGYLPKGLGPVVMVVLQDGIPEGLHSIISKHQIARNNDSDLALAPPLIETRVIFRRVATSLDILALLVPMAETLRHCRKRKVLELVSSKGVIMISLTWGLQEPVTSCSAGEGECDGLGECADVDLGGFDPQSAIVASKGHTLVTISFGLRRTCASGHVVLHLRDLSAELEETGEEGSSRQQNERMGRTYSDVPPGRSVRACTATSYPRNGLDRRLAAKAFRHNRSTRAYTWRDGDSEVP